MCVNIKRSMQNRFRINKHLILKVKLEKKKFSLSYDLFVNLTFRPGDSLRRPFDILEMDSYLRIFSCQGCKNQNNSCT